MEAGLPRAAERTEQTATGEPAFAMLLSETANLAKRERELTVARAELTGLREGRHTFLRAGQVFFRTPSETTKQAVTGARRAPFAFASPKHLTMRLPARAVLQVTLLLSRRGGGRSRARSTGSRP
mmetsp:Transcript_38823/g.95992  ORF Transcript_38823/g.95992 Transcript_38823/m.95992 type:complete len:125 (-) Transcript_38823:200-574(-)